MPPPETLQNRSEKGVWWRAGGSQKTHKPTKTKKKEEERTPTQFWNLENREVVSNVSKMVKLNP